MPLNPAASTTAGQFAASMLVRRAASTIGPAPAIWLVTATGLVTATLVVPATGDIATAAEVAAGPFPAARLVAAADVVPATLTGFNGCAAASGRNANIRSKVISKPIRGSGAMFKSRRPASAI